MRLRFFSLLQRNFSPIITIIHPAIRLKIARLINIEGVKTLFDPNSLRRFSYLKNKACLRTISFTANTKMQVDINDFIGFRSALNQKWDNTSFNLINKIGKSKCIYIDIGANIGTTSIPVGVLGVPVIAFEPHKKLASMLLHNAAINDLKRIDIFNLALSDTKSSDNYLTLHSPTGNTGASSLEDKWRLGKSNNFKSECYISTLDKCLAFNNYNFNGKILIIKIDVEGHEKEVLDGAKKIMSQFRPIVIFENNPKPNIDANTYMKYFKKTFKAYNLFEVDENLALSIFSPVKTSNVLAIPGELTELIRGLKDSFPKFL